MDPGASAELFRRVARDLGFARIGFAPVGPVARHGLYRAWLDRGFAGDMEYLRAHADERRDPGMLLANARTMVSVALSYAHPDPPAIPADRLGRGPSGQIARYARGDDYHVIMKTKLRALALAAAEQLGRSIAIVSCVDTAPVLEREAAHASGIGFIAKNTMLIAPGAGSYLLLGELLTDVECAPSGPMEPRCGECRRCLDGCPTGAFVDAYTLDARRCISYLTIEQSGPIPLELRPLMGDHIFGCDVCQEVCPFNGGGGRDTGGAPELAPRPGYSRPALTRLLATGAAQFRKWQRQSALRRIHRPQLLRNVAVALGNVGTIDELPALAAALAERHALARAHVAWAIGRIGARHPGSDAAAILARAKAVETDREVLAEIDAATELLTAS